MVNDCLFRNNGSGIAPITSCAVLICTQGGYNLEKKANVNLIKASTDETDR